jgi:hypothetical protein
MKNKVQLILFIFALGIILNSCSKSNNTTKTGYTCKSGNFQYATIADCQNASGGGRGVDATTGSVLIATSRPVSVPWNLDL